MKTVFAFCLRSLLLLCLYVFCTASLLGAQSSGHDEETRITALSITGLRRTRLSTAQRPLRKFIGLKASQVNIDEVWAAILEMEILEPLSVKVEGEILVVEVREKWSIFPVPLVMGGSWGVSGGLAFYDANAFGLNDKFFLAGIFSSASWSASAGYIHASRGGLFPGLNGMVVFRSGEQNDRDQKNKNLRIFELDTLSFNLGIVFNPLEKFDPLSTSALFSFENKTLRNTEKAMNGPDSDLRLFGTGMELALRKSSWDGYLLSQQSASLRYVYKTSFDGLSFHSLRFRGTWEQSLVPGFRLVVRTGLVFEPDVPVLFESSPSAAQVAILPRYFSARNYTGISAGMEKYILKIPSGTFSVAGAYQFVYSRGSVLGDSVDHGPVGMLFFYLRRLAIPALGLGVAYNVKENYIQGSFSFGMSF